VKTKKLVISYFPLFYPSPEFLGRIIGIEDQEEIKRIFDDCGEHIRVHGVLWANYPSEKDNCPKSIIPVMIIDRMVEVVDHLEYWSEFDPKSWFTLGLKSKSPNNYVISLMPNLGRSIERQESACDNFGDHEYIILFDTLKTVCHGNTLPMVKNRIHQESFVGFVDINNIDRDNPLSLDLDLIRVIGPVGVSLDLDDFVGSYLDSVFEEYKKDGALPEGKSVNFLCN
jgi:hypothetical protein